MKASGEVNTRGQRRDAGALLFNPHTYDPSHFDDATRSLLRATIDWFEQRGKETLLRNYRECVWYADFLEFIAKEHLFAKMGTPAREANGDLDKRWDTNRISAFSEVLAFYGVDYWYAWQVTILGLGPIWQSDNAGARQPGGPVEQRHGLGWSWQRSGGERACSHVSAHPWQASAQRRTVWRISGASEE